MQIDLLFAIPKSHQNYSNFNAALHLKWLVFLYELILEIKKT